jgi:hypothetical protein
MEFVSIGPNCGSADLLKQYKLRTKAYPFDYIFSSLEAVKHSIQDKFKIFLDKQYYTPGTRKDATRHTFYCKMLDTDVLKEHHYREHHRTYNPSSGNFFNHHNLLENEAHYEAFQRRTARLLHLLETNQNVVFVYCNYLTQDIQDLVEFSRAFSENQHIFVLGIFRNHSEKKILYNEGRCKIYQNYDDPFIFNEIKSIAFV